MSVNKYFQRGNGNDDSGMSRLIQGIVTEVIKQSGWQVYYLPRSLTNLDQLFLEDPLSKFEHAFPIEVYLENVMGFAGDDFMSKFGFTINDSGTFVVSKTRFEEAVNRSGKTRLERPAEGDILFFPRTQSYFEIKKCDVSNPFFMASKNYVYKMDVELFRYSSERIETGVPMIDNIELPFGRIDDEADELKVTLTDINADNDVLDTLNDDVIDWCQVNEIGLPSRL